MGENTNCIRAQAVANTPKMRAARTVSPPTKLSTSFDRIGITSPSASLPKEAPGSAGVAAEV